MRAATLVMTSLFLAACTNDDATELILPPVADLPEVTAPPPALVSWQTGETIASAEQWTTERVPELQTLFGHYVYGEWPTGTASDTTEVFRGNVRLGTLQQHRASHDRGELLVALFLPPTSGPHPVVLGLNKCGNTTVFDDAALFDNGSYIDPTCIDVRGSRSDYWSLEQAMDAGWAVATVHQSDTAPDDRDAIQPAPTVVSWAWGLSLAVDVLVGLDDVDAERIVVFGHSRRGKAALVAGAHDPRIAAVWAHQSGTVGAALTRSFEGESLEAITTFFPHWFDERLAEFVDDELRLPIDQHLLLAQIAPRPLLVTDGTEDDWADPAGAEQAVSLAAPVFELLEGPSPVWQSRPGTHDVRAEDWQTALDFFSEQVP